MAAAAPKCRLFHNVNAPKCERTNGRNDKKADNEEWKRVAGRRGGSSGFLYRGPVFPERLFELAAKHPAPA
jgi:hypothetical protein